MKLEKTFIDQANRHNRYWWLRSIVLAHSPENKADIGAYAGYVAAFSYYNVRKPFWIAASFVI